MTFTSAAISESRFIVVPGDACNSEIRALNFVSGSSGSFLMLVRAPSVDDPEDAIVALMFWMS